MIPSNCVEELLLELELWKVSVQIHEIEDDILLDELDELLELELLELELLELELLELELLDLELELLELELELLELELTELKLELEELLDVDELLLELYPCIINSGRHPTFGASLLQN